MPIIAAAMPPLNGFRQATIKMIIINTVYMLIKIPANVVQSNGR
jgi:hypothetical protein